MAEKIKFRFTLSQNSFKGIAFDEEKDIVVNFSLNIEKGSIDGEGKPWSIIILRTDARVLGVKVYDFFNRTISKYGEKDHRYPSVHGQTLECLWRIYDNKLEKLKEELRKSLNSQT